MITDLDPMTLKYAANMHIMKMYLRTKTELCSSQLSTVTASQTDIRDRNITMPHSWVVVTFKFDWISK